MSEPPVLAASQLPNDQTRPLHLLWSVERALRLETRAVETRLGLSAAQLWALSKLGEGPGMSLSGLAERLGTHESSASVAVKRLEARGLVLRQRSRKDRRRVEVALTDAGRSMLAKLPFVLIRVRLERSLLAMPKEEQVALSRLLEAWLRSAAVLG